MEHATRLHAPGERGWMLLILAGTTACVLIFAFALSGSPSTAFDDAYITYRYAANLRDGHGLVYNLGERVLGTTTPLFASALAALSIVQPNIETLGYWFAIAGWIAAALSSAALLAAAGRVYGACVACVLIALQPSIAIGIGMETSWVVALMAASAWAWLTRRRAWIIVLSAALILTRPDGALWILVLGLVHMARDRRVPWREAIGVVALAAPWFLFSSAYYGTLLPNSAMAKIGQNAYMQVGGADAFLPALLKSMITDGSALASVLVSALCVAGVWVSMARDRRLLFLPMWLLAYVAIYSALGTASFPWYFTPVIFAIVLLAALGADELIRGSGAWPRAAQWAARALTVGALAIIAFARAGETHAAASTRAGHSADYPAVGRWLAENASPDARVATIEIGVIGYLSGRPIIDTMGLVSPAMREHLVGWTETVVYAVTQLAPDYAVAVDGTAWDFVRDQWWFQRDYLPATRIGQVTIFKRRPASENDIGFDADVQYATGFRVSSLRTSERRLQPGRAWDGALNIEVSRTPPSDYEFVTYLVDAQTYRRWGETKFRGFDGGYASDRWRSGDRLALPFRIDVPADLPAGAYRVGLSVYDTRVGQTLSIQGDAKATDATVGWLRAGDPPSLVGKRPPANDDAHPAATGMDRWHRAGVGRRAAARRPARRDRAHSVRLARRAITAARLGVLRASDRCRWPDRRAERQTAARRPLLHRHVVAGRGHRRRLHAGGAASDAGRALSPARRVLRRLGSIAAGRRCRGHGHPERVHRHRRRAVTAPPHACR